MPNLHIFGKAEAGDGMRTRKFFLYLFLAGMTAGILCLILKKSAWLAHTDLWTADMIEAMSAMSLQGGALFATLLYRRGIRFLGISLLATTYLGSAACFCAAFGCGLAFGVYLASAGIRLGMKGILLALVGILPQGILYGVLLYGILTWCRKTCAMIYGRDRQALKTPVLMERVLSWSVLLLLLVAGCALESYVNPALLRGIAGRLF